MVPGAELPTGDRFLFYTASLLQTLFDTYPQGVYHYLENNIPPQGIYQGGSHVLEERHQALLLQEEDALG